MRLIFYSVRIERHLLYPMEKKNNNKFRIQEFMWNNLIVKVKGIKIKCFLVSSSPTNHGAGSMNLCNISVGEWMEWDHMNMNMKIEDDESLEEAFCIHLSLLYYLILTCGERYK